MSRPKGTRMPANRRRVRINTTIAPQTAASLAADRRPGEGQGQVIDRWAEQARKEEQK